MAIIDPPSIQINRLSEDDMLILEALKEETQALIELQWGTVKAAQITGPPHWVLWTFYLLIKMKERDAAVLGVPLDSLEMWVNFYGYQEYLNREASQALDQA